MAEQSLIAVSASIIEVTSAAFSPTEMDTIESF